MPVHVFSFPLTLRRSRAAALAAAALLGVPGAGQAAETGDATSLRTAQIAATCANCHGGGVPLPATSVVPALAGLPPDAFVARMAAFRAGQREATVMHQIAKGLDAAQVERLAAWFAAAPAAR